MKSEVRRVIKQQGLNYVSTTDSTTTTYVVYSSTRVVELSADDQQQGPCSMHVLAPNMSNCVALLRYRAGRGPRVRSRA